MEYRPLDITVISAENLKDVNLISKMDVYVEVSIGGDPIGKRKTHVDKDGGKSPKWNHRLKFAVDVNVLAANPALPLLFKIRSDRPLGDKDIGDVSVPIKELLDSAASDGERVVEYKVRTPSGKPKGTLKFSYKFGDKLAAPVEPPPPKFKSKNIGGEAVTAYPAHPGPSAAYPPSAHVGYAQPYAAGYAPPQPGYGYPPPQPGYGAPPPAPGYGYPAPVQAAMQKPKKKSNLGLGLAGGLLGGLLVGDMISDVGDMSSYDAGIGDAGFDF